jgi:hypothetical protein
MCATKANRRETAPRREPVTVPQRVPARRPAKPAPAREPAPVKPAPQRTPSRGLLIALALWLSVSGPAAADFPYALPLKVSENKRFLVQANGKPFFYLADTAWELFHRLKREEVDAYLKNRADKGFTIIQAVVLAEFDGLTAPNPYDHLPLKDRDPTNPNEDYFKHVDYVVNQAEKRGLMIGMLPTWGDKWNKKWGVGPEIFTEKNAATYGEWLGKRYKEKPIIWILGGDRPVEKIVQKDIIRAMAKGLKKGDGGRHLMTFHPPGGKSSAHFFFNISKEDKWLDFNMLQSGHDFNNDNFYRIRLDYQRKPVKPCLDGEPGYEDHPAAFKKENGYLTDHDARKAAYWALFAGACGHTYGCHDIWQFLDKERKPITFARTPWRKALDLPGAGQMIHARRLLESRPYLSRIPDQQLLLSKTAARGDHAQATRDADGSYAFIYLPSGKPVTIDLTKLSGKNLTVHWYDPRTGQAKQIESIDRKMGNHEFKPPAKGPDWVLVLDDEAKKYPPPGKKKK